MSKSRDQADNRDNAGQLTYSISRDVSLRRHFAREARRLLDCRELGGEDPDLLARLRTLTEELERAAAHGDAMWERIEAAAMEDDPTLIEPTSAGVSVIHNHGPNHGLTRKLRAIWSEGRGSDRSPHDLYEEVKGMLALGESNQ
jgi:hypothetical protein